MFAKPEETQMKKLTTCLMMLCITAFLVGCEESTPPFAPLPDGGADEVVEDATTTQANDVAVQPEVESEAADQAATEDAAAAQNAAKEATEEEATAEEATAEEATAKEATAKDAAGAQKAADEAAAKKAAEDEAAKKKAEDEPES
jgi:hypothetical protein